MFNCYYLPFGVTLLLLFWNGHVSLDKFHNIAFLIICLSANSVIRQLLFTSKALYRSLAGVENVTQILVVQDSSTAKAFYRVFINTDMGYEHPLQIVKPLHDFLHAVGKNRYVLRNILYVFTVHFYVVFCSYFFVSVAKVGIKKATEYIVCT